MGCLNFPHAHVTEVDLNRVAHTPFSQTQTIPLSHQDSVRANIQHSTAMNHSIHSLLSLPRAQYQASLRNHPTQHRDQERMGQPSRNVYLSYRTEASRD